MENNKLDKLKSLLDENYKWPCSYKFKFVVPKNSANVVDSMLSDCQLSTKESKTGKYISFTAEKVVNSSDDVLEVYKMMSSVEGIISF